MRIQELTEIARDPQLDLPEWYQWLQGKKYHANWGEAVIAILKELGLGNNPKSHEIYKITWEHVHKLYGAYSKEIDSSNTYDPLLQRKYKITEKLLDLFPKSLDTEITV
jgi:hypothetical protein